MSSALGIWTVFSAYLAVLTCQCQDEPRIFTKRENPANASIRIAVGGEALLYRKRLQDADELLMFMR
jgi:hypothetical protein